MLIIALSLWLVYAPSLEYDFVSWDDERFVQENPMIRALDGAHLRRIFTSWEFEHYTPLQFLSYAVDYRRWGQDPFGYHLTNLGLHMINTGLLYGLLWTLTRRWWLAWWVAALFAVHPVQVEAVVWISERKTLLSAAFGLGAVWAHIRPWGAVRRGRIAVGALVLGALLAKPSAVSIVAAIIAYDWIVRREPLRRAVVRHLGLIAVATACAALTLASHARVGALAPVPVRSREPWAIAATIAVVWLRYLGLALWPRDLSLLYDVRVVETLLRPDVIAAAVVLAGLGAAAIGARRRQPLATWSAAWFVAHLLPVSGLVPIATWMNDRYLYLAGVAVWAPATAAGLALAHRVTSRAVGGWRSVTTALGVGAAAALLVALSLMTLRQASVWASPVTLWQHVVRRMPGSGAAHLNLADAYAARDLDALALAEYELARLYDNKHDGGVQNNRGTFYFDRGRYAEAIAQYRQAIARNASSDIFRMNLARALAAAGEWEEAEAVRRQVVARWPSARSHLLLGSLLKERGRSDEALVAFQEALARAPDDPMAHRYLADAYRVLEGADSPTAAYHAHRAVALVRDVTDGKGAIAYLRRGLRYARLGNAEAIWQFKRAAILDPTLADAHYNLGVAYLAMEPPRVALARPALERAAALGFPVPDAVRRQLETQDQQMRGNE